MNTMMHRLTINDNTLPCRHIPYYDDVQNSRLNFSKKLDLNLYCVKRPQQTCFIRVTNPNLLAWGIEVDDMLVVEKSSSLAIGDLVVVEIDSQFQVYEFMIHQNNEFIFFALDSTQENIKTDNWLNLPIIGTVTNTIHQMKPKNKMRFAA